MDGERTYMKFEKVVIKNFRNFDNVELDLSNKNIFFGQIGRASCRERVSSPV